MSDFLILCGKLGFLALLWIFVFSCVNVIRTDMFGKKVPAKNQSPLANSAAPLRRANQYSTSPALVVTQGRQRGMEIPLSGDIVIGRSPDSNFVIDDDFSSGHHAAVRKNPRGGYYVEDLGSMNGTRINEVEIHQPTSLGLNDELRIGQTVMKLVM